MTTMPPWPCNSSTSSPVKEFGAGKYNAMPESSIWPPESLKCEKVASLGRGIRPSIARATRSVSAPDTLIIPIPPRPVGVAIAAMVSRSDMAVVNPGLGAVFFARIRLGVANHDLVDIPLLGDGEHIVYQPV